MRNEELLSVIGLGMMTLAMIVFLTVIIYIPEIV